MGKSLAFVHYMLGLIDASPDGLDETKTNLAKEKLKDVFIHEIDPSFGFSKTEFEEVNKVHSGEANKLPSNDTSSEDDFNLLESVDELVRC